MNEKTPPRAVLICTIYGCKNIAVIWIANSNDCLCYLHASQMQLTETR